MFKTTVTSQSRVPGHLGNVFMKSSTIYIILTISLLFTAQKEKLPHKYTLKGIFKHFVVLKWLRKTGLNFGPFDL